MVVVSIAVLLLLVLCETYSLPMPNNNLNIYVLPVGQGDATVIQCPKGTGGLTIVDVGSSKYKPNFMSSDDLTNWLCGGPATLSCGALSIEHILLSHPDKDHYNYVGALECPSATGDTKNVDCLTIYHTCNAKEYRHLSLNMLYWKNVRVVRVERPGVVKICNNHVNLEVVATERGGCDEVPVESQEEKYNEDSLVLKLEYCKKRVLFPGDISGKALRDLSKSDSIKADALRLPHHGSFSDGADLFTFISKVGARTMFSSSGFVKNLHYPHCDILERFCNDLSKTTKHWYTCYDAKGALRTKLIDLQMYSSAVCEIPSRSVLYQKAYIIHLSITPGGLLEVATTMYRSSPNLSDRRNNRYQCVDVET